MKRRILFLLSVLSGLLFSLSWPARGLPFFAFIAFVPLLYLEDELCRRNPKPRTISALLLSYPAFFVWNLLTTWWIWNATAFGAIMAVLLNSLFMSIIFMLYHWSKRILFGYGKGYFLLAAYWISFEFLHMRWDLTWSWLNLGNVFANYPSLVQWYEYTGIFGGAVWIFLFNILLYRLVVGFTKKEPAQSGRTALIILASLALLLPIIISLLVKSRYAEKPSPVNVVVVQPNIDPYTEQYELTLNESFDRVFKLGKQKTDTATELFVAPESILQEDIWENDITGSRSYSWLKAFLGEYPNLDIVIGASTFYRFSSGEKLTETARWSKAGKFNYDAYNTAIFLNRGQPYTLYHKSKLVVGVERMPFPKYLKFLKNYAIDLGGTVGSLGISENRAVHTAAGQKFKVGAAICYESVYGEFFSGFVRNGANIMCIITNDGWWGNTPGHRQHLSFARLRAIENRRCIARAANTGISCFVDQRGTISQAANYWEPAVISGVLNSNDRITFYTRYGDYLGRIALCSFFVSLLASLFFRMRTFKKAMGSPSGE